MTALPSTLGPAVEPSDLDVAEPAPHRPRPERGRARAGARSTMLLLATAAILLVGTALAGVQVLIVRSGSMAPVIDTGDAIVVRQVEAREVVPGHVVTFRDPLSPARLLTHRVISVDGSGDRLTFTTGGDANLSVESWQISPTGTVGRLLLTVPRAGFLLHYLGGSALPIVLAAGAIFLFTHAGRSPGPARSARGTTTRSDD